ncbi:MAG: hypothetical protein QM726_11560 [Chitinophagaceae bacterium]
MKNKQATKKAGPTEKKDLQKQDQDFIVMDMPEVKDIPGQENIQVPRFKEMQDTTISSADEEGDGILDDLNKPTDTLETDNTSNVSRVEKRMLRKSAGPVPTDETEDFNEMVLDEKDDDGEYLNEKSIRQDRNGEDLDVPGAELDDDDEDLGDEDEENNIYSQRD